MSSPDLDPSVLATTRTAAGDSLASLSARGPLLLVFLRHFGCPLCQEMVADVAARRAAIVASGTTVVFVHMHPEPQAAAYFARFGVSDLQRVSDPGCTLYRAVGAPRGRPSSWLSLQVLGHYWSAIVGGGHLPGYVGGDVGQMSAVIRLVDGRIERAELSPLAARPDFDDLLACPRA
jgi:peroxiredoxin